MTIEDHELSHNDVLYWQNRLQERKKSILEARDFLKKHTLKDLSVEEAGEISRVRLHPADLATQAQDEVTLESLLEKNLKVTQDIEDALERLEKGVFGVCQSCGEMIARSRLEAIPETLYCLSCQMDMEEIKGAYRKQNRKIATPIREENSRETFEKPEVILVSDVMQGHPLTIRMDQGVDVANQLMFEHNIRHLPVVDRHGEVQGVISDRDLLSVALEPRSWESVDEIIDYWSKKSVASIMTKTPETASPDMTLKEASTILLDNKISCLPVVDGNRLVGIITDTDFVKIFSK